MRNDIIEYKQSINKKMQKRQELRESQKLLNDDNYFYWLNEFSNKMPIFVENFDYEIDKIDKDNIKNTSILYNLVKMEAKNKSINVNSFSRGIYYVIENMEINYQIGLATINDRLVYFCSKCDNVENVEIINIDYLRKQNKLKKQKDIEELKQLKSLVIKLLERDINEKDIVSSVDEGIEEHKEKQLRKIYFDTD